MLSPKDVGGNAEPFDYYDSDAEWVDGRLLITEIDPSAYYRDMGGKCGAMIGDQLWCDADVDFAFDAGEELPGVTVRLYSDPDCDGDATDGELLATDVTDADGEYEFGPLPVCVGLIITENEDDHECCYVVIVDNTDPDLGDCTMGINKSRVWVHMKEPTEQMDHDFMFRRVPEVVVEEGVPEAGTILLMGSGLLGLAGYAGLRLRRK